MVPGINYGKVPSLYSMCMHAFGDNLLYYIDDLERLKSIPEYMKAPLFKKIMTKIKYYKFVDMNTLIKTFIYPSLTDMCFERMDGTHLTYETLELFLNCTNLRRIYIKSFDYPKMLNSHEIFKCLLMIIERNKYLTEVDVEGCIFFRDEGLLKLAENCPNLKTLNVRNTSITDVGLIAVANGCHSLCGLDISGTQVTDKGIEALVKNCPIQELRINNCHKLTPEAAILIEKFCPNIEVLTFENVEFLSSFSSRNTSIRQLNWTVRF